MRNLQTAPEIKDLAMDRINFKKLGMKKIFVLYKILFLGLPAFAQVTIGAGAQLVNSGNVTITIHNLDLVNNGGISAGSSVMKFAGTTNNTIGGNSTTGFFQLEIAKGGGNKLTLLSNTNVNNQVTFSSGLLDLNQRNLTLAGSAIFANENENNRVITPNGGEVIITVNLNKPNAVNPGNLGAIISSTANMGAVTIKRGHRTQAGAGIQGSINRYFIIQPYTNSGLNATLRFKYFNAELNAQAEDSLGQFTSADDGATWTNQSFTARDAAANYVEKTGITSFSLVTLSRDSTSQTPAEPVTGLAFNATRKKSSEVQLTWNTVTETNMNGYEVQRRLDNESNFSARTFVNSLAPGGNSLVPLSYTYTDANSYTGTSYYRLKIVDLNNSVTYSDIKIVTGKTRGGSGHNNTILVGDSISAGSARTETAVIEKKLALGPNPNNGKFWFSVNGIDKETTATLYTMDGKSLKQFRVTKGQQQQVTDLKSGIYILKVEGLTPFRIVVQGAVNPSGSYPVINNYQQKN
jgi:hypothetical protein